jgi:hypothetical protein
MGNYIIVRTTETEENGMPKKPGIINGGFSISQMITSILLWLLPLMYKSYHEKY